MIAAVKKSECDGLKCCVACGAKCESPHRADCSILGMHEYPALRLLYRTANRAMVKLGMNGKISSDHRDINDLMDALAVIDGGSPIVDDGET